MNPGNPRFQRPNRFLAASLLLTAFLFPASAFCQSATSDDRTTHTWDGKHSTKQIDVTVVYFVPADRSPLPDWRDRVDYYCRRLETFHAREFQGQSAVKMRAQAAPFVSAFTTRQLRRGDGDAIFFRTLGEVDERLNFGRDEKPPFRILLVLSEINHRPLDDFYRLASRDGKLVFEGNYNAGKHFPGSKLGGARATYLANRRAGWGLVSADGWRVPYRGSDCVVYHEGLGHTVGLPHPEPGDGSVMSQGQYRGWLSESWLKDEQKRRLGWKPSEMSVDGATRLYNEFRALPMPPQPRPGQLSKLKIDAPEGSKLKSMRVRFQTAVDGPWINVPISDSGGDSQRSDVPQEVVLGAFERPTPVSYRVNLETDAGQAELWGYFQVRDSDNSPPLPLNPPFELVEPESAAVVAVDPAPGEQRDLLEELDVKACFSTGKWELNDQGLTSSKGYGVRLELPFTLPKYYRMVANIEPLDPANGLLFGLLNQGDRFVSLVNYRNGNEAASAVENVDGKNVGNETTFRGNLLKMGQLSQVVVTVNRKGVTVSVDGRRIIDWEGRPDQLSLSDYWKTPDAQKMFLGTYDCRYRFSRLTIEPIEG